jgi:ribosomal-protein-alanine N-acetyltransferase
MQPMPHEPNPSLHLVPLDEERLDALLRIEQSVYSNPWSRGNFLDAIKHNNWCYLLMHESTLVGYFVAMMGFQEVHLLNITVAKDHQGQGLGLYLLENVKTLSKAVQAQWIWLEVRVSNTRAIEVYQTFGFQRVGERKNYYPLRPGIREDAMIMSLRL